MKPVLFGNIQNDKSTSMHIYLKELTKNFPKKFSYELIYPQSRSNKYQLFAKKHFFYPLLARKYYGDINHILDHSYGHLAQFIPKEKTITTCHDLIPFIDKKVTSNIGRNLFKWYISGMLRSKKIITVSENTKKDILSRYNYPKENIVVVPNGVSEKFKKISDKKKEKKKEEWGFKNKRIILSIGIAEYKNINGTIEAFNEISKKEKESHLIKVGKFTFEQEKKIVNYNLKNKVSVYEFLDEKKLVELYSIADLLIFPSFYEGFGLPVIEAMASGCPVVTSTRGSLPEISNKCALLANPYNQKELNQASFRAYTDDSLRKEMIKKGIKRAKNFSWKKTAKSTISVYESIFRK